MLDKAPQNVDQSFRERVQHFLDPKNAFAEKLLDLDAFVVSFCARANQSVHWLHYGRNGTGWAIGLDPVKLFEGPFSLFCFLSL